MDIAPYKKPEYFRNRELSWVSFDERVLNEARDKSIPLFERLKFISITSSNLDEFYMVRVASLKDQVHANYTKRICPAWMRRSSLPGSANGHTSWCSCSTIRTIARRFRLWSTLAFTIISEHEKLTKEQAEYVDSYF